MALSSDKKTSKLMCYVTFLSLYSRRVGHKVELKVLYQFRKHRNDRKSKLRLFSFNCSCLMHGVCLCFSDR